MSHHDPTGAPPPTASPAREAPTGDGEQEQHVPTLLEPADGVPPLCRTQAQLQEAAARLGAGRGPVALDAERASGHRYGQRAFLIQAKRSGSGIVLIDPEELSDLTDFAEAIAGQEWVLHSATQDLACLAEAGLHPQRLFDTELAARLLNLPRVGLASLTASLLDWHLAKGHSAADWSVRPLPQDYLRYAALDVELLLQLRDVLESQLRRAGKWEWAQQEFDALLQWAPRHQPDPWRRTSGSHRLRKPRNLAVLRALWQARDALARQLDIAPGRVLPDAALVAASQDPPDSRAALLQLPGFKRQQRRAALWWDAIRSALDLPPEQLPPLRLPSDGPPHPRSWRTRDPDAAQRFTRARERVLAVAQACDVPAEVLISPDLVRRLAWQPPQPLDAGAVAAFLEQRGARPWQCGQVAGPLAEALAAAGVPGTP